MAVSDYTGASPRMQQEPDKLVYNPETGQVELVPGEMVELSPEQHHTSLAKTLLKSAPYFAAPFGAAGLEALAGPAGGMVSGAASGSVPGHMAATGGLPTGPLAGVNPSVGAAPWAPSFSSGVVAPATAPGIAPTIGSSPTFMGGTAGATAPAAATGGGAAGSVAGGAAAGVAPVVAKQGFDADRWGPLIETGVGLGLGAWQNQRANSASDEALRIQQAATDRAMAENKAAFAPYMNTGSQASNTLAALSGFSPLPASGATAPMPSDVTGGERMGPTAGAAPGEQIHGLRPVEGTPYAQSLADLARPAVAKQQTASGYVRMRDDDGEEMNVPPNRVQELERLGAVRL